MMTYVIVQCVKSLSLEFRFNFKIEQFVHDLFSIVFSYELCIFLHMRIYVLVYKLLLKNVCKLPDTFCASLFLSLNSLKNKTAE